jgi:hypothetical protein
MILADFINRHAGREAWLFGKGPSLSGFNFSDAGEIRCAINDATAHVPGVKYCFANDGVALWADVYTAGQTLFQPARCLGEYDSMLAGAVACDVVAYDDTHDDHRLLLSRDHLAQLLTIRRGTLGSALQILHIMGIKTVHLVGIDGGGQHAEGYQFRTRLRADHAKDYNAIKDAAIDSAALMGIKLIFHSTNPDTHKPMTTDGKQFVTITRNTFVAGVPYCQGEVASFNPGQVAQLIGCRAAEIFEGRRDEPPVVETASLETVRETAAMPAKRGRKKSR